MTRDQTLDSATTEQRQFSRNRKFLNNSACESKLYSPRKSKTLKRKVIAFWGNQTVFAETCPTI